MSEVHWGGSTLITVLTHFPELEPELELFGSGYYADLLVGQLEIFLDLDMPCFRISIVMDPSISCS
jgi:hypothetical protein